MSSEALLDYQERTKHTYESVRRGGHALDWGNVPSRLKRYRDLEGEPLPEPTPTEMPSHEAVAGSARPEGDAPLTRDAVSHLLYHAAGVSRVAETMDGPLHFRTYASAGALYPIETYLVCRSLDGLNAGVYHYAPAEHALVRLREGDVRGSLGLADADPGDAAVVLTGIPFRTAWKYGPRGFRHLYWDAGTMLANLLAAAAARDAAARVLLGFVDRSVNEVLGVDGESEFALAVVPLGRNGRPAEAEVSPLSVPADPVAPRPLRDPLIEEAHRATVLESEDEVRSFRAAGPGREPATGVRADHQVVPTPVDTLSRDGIEAVVRRRGSSRRLAREPFPAAEYSAILDRALAGVPSDWSGTGPAVFLVANALEGLPAGAYRYGSGGRFETIREGDLRGEAGFLCLEQRLGADAAATAFLMTDLGRVLGSPGERGYAAAQLEAGIVAGRMYLGAYAQCLGASGITFYDDGVRRFFDTEREPMMSVVMGPEGHRRSIIRCRSR